jgi:hypothetical protein
MILFFLIAVLSWIIQLFLPWWGMAIIAATVSFFLSKKAFQTFLAGFFACGLVWLLMELYITMVNGSLMTDRMANLFSLPTGILLFVVSFIVAGLVGGLSALAGRFLKEAIK